MRELSITQGRCAIVDDEDYERVAAFKWHAIRKRHDLVYVGRKITDPSTGKRRTQSMPVEILGLPTGTLVDHVNGNSLDNRRVNLRRATATQNAQNARKPISAKTSRFRGVYFCRRDRLWYAKIRANCRRFFLGTFREEEAAARAYDAAARLRHGEFARLNFPLEAIHVGR